VNHTDPIADLLTRIRNAILVKKKTVSMPYSKIKEEILKVLVKVGFISNVEVLPEEESSKKELKVKLKYVNKESAIVNLKRQSRPGCRLYSSPDFKAGGTPQHSVTIFTTSKGIITDKEAKELGVGGEVLCTVW
jgi:small subunit ribosomal protein S8